MIWLPLVVWLLMSLIPTNLDREDAVAPAAGVVHGGTPHGAAGHALVDQPLHAVRRSHHHFLKTRKYSSFSYPSLRTSAAIELRETRPRKRFRTHDS